MAKFVFHWGAFIVALAIGMLFVYVRIPTPKIVIKYPNPENAGKVVYKDEADNCYTYNASKTECPVKESDKEAQPVSI